MIEPQNKLSISKQCKLLNLPKATYYYTSTKKEKQNSFFDIVTTVFLKYPFYGYRKINLEIKKQDINTSRKRVRQAMSMLNLKAIYPKPRLSIANSEHKKFPYLLKDIKIEYPNQVWASDITYIKHKSSAMYLSAIIDINSRKILSWKISNTMDISICTDILQEALINYGTPEIFNTDQGSQYTSNVFTDMLINKGIKVSMDSKGRALDNIYIERFWRSLKYENIFINDYRSVFELKIGISRYMKFYNNERFHQSLLYKTPNEVYSENQTRTISQ